MSVKIEHVGVSSIGLLGVAFVVLKLTGAIDWPWLWVTLPFWLTLAIAVFFFVAWCAAVLCRRIYIEIKRRNSNKW